MANPFRLYLIAGAGLLACTPSPADLNLDVVPWTPPATYTVWWEEVEECSQEAGDFSAVQWYLASGFAAGAEVVGQWSPPHSITFRHGFESKEFVVKHEVLHDLLQGDQFHDELAWLRCRLPIG